MESCGRANYAFAWNEALEFTLLTLYAPCLLRLDNEKTG